MKRPSFYMPWWVSAALMLAAISLAACSAGGTSEQAPPTDQTAGQGESEGPPPGTENLPGRLVYTEGLRGISAYEFATGTQTRLFEPPLSAFVQSASVSPDGSTLLMAYAPPGDTPETYGFSDLYVMPADGSAPPELLLDAPSGEKYAQPAWSPDGSMIYFTHETPTGEAYGGQRGLLIEAMAYPDGTPEVIAESAFWPRISPDGSRLAYISAAGTVDELAVANVDGSDPQVIVPEGQFAAIDSVTWSPDGESILFSAVLRGGESRLDWLYALMGVGIARAHETPSDLFRVSASGGEPERLTEVADFGLHAAFSPDGGTIALLRASGIYLMPSDGGELQRLLGQGPVGTVDWVP